MQSFVFRFIQNNPKLIVSQTNRDLTTSTHNRIMKRASCICVATCFITLIKFYGNNLITLSISSTNKSNVKPVCYKDDSMLF